MESSSQDRFIPVELPYGGAVRMLLPRQHDGGWLYSREMLDKIAHDEGSVLITGETGTGKELLAYYLHNNSRRFKGPFVAVNCTGLTEDRMQAELFGWKKGAFTSSVDDYRGRVGEAEGGTLFLDEIAAMDPLNQARLLRFMQTGEIEPLGGKKLRADVRVIAATNRAVHSGKDTTDLIPDLFFRFRYRNLTLPALRDRQSDVFRLLLEPDFLGTEDPFTGITLPTLLMLAAQDWPGNIRELKQYCDDARLFADSNRTDVEIISHGNAQKQPLPNHIFHDARFFLREMLAEAALVFCLHRTDEAFRKQQRRSAGFWNTTRLLWSLHSGEGFLGSCLIQVREEHVIPLSAFLDVLAGADHKHWGAFEFRILNAHRPREMWLPTSWKRENCSMADALANLGYFCRAHDKKLASEWNVQSLEKSNKAWLAETHRRIETLVKLAGSELSAELERQGKALPSMPMPEPPHQPDLLIGEKLAKLDPSRCRKHDFEIVRKVMKLSFQGKKPGEIASLLNDSLRVSQIKGIIRIYRQ